jgi:hypothetical protein
MAQVIAPPAGPTDDVLPVEEADFTDEELTELALAAEVDSPLDPDAVPLDLYASHAVALLPAWYMPPVMARARSARPWRRSLVFVLIAAFLLVDAFGLCITYGQLVVA